MNKKREIEMTSGNLFFKILMVSVPLMLSGILQLLYNACDLIVCGNFGSGHSVAAISATNSLINLIINLFLGLSVGTNVLMARAFGAKDLEKGQRIVHTSMLVAVIVGFIVGIFGFTFSKYFLEWMKTPDDVIDLSTTYLKIYFLGIPFSMVYNFGASLLRATGDTKRPFYFLGLSGIVNVLVNLLLVIVFDMDVSGVAIATVISQAISATLIVICLIKTKGYCNLNLKKLKIHNQEMVEMIKIGLPSGLQGAIFSISNVLIQSSINSLGTIVMDGNGASSSLEGFVYTSMNSVAQTSLAFISANYGAKKINNMKKSLIYSSILVFLFGITLGGLVILLGKPLLSLYVKGESIDFGYKRLLIICSTYFLCGLMDTFGYALRGIGYYILPMVISLCGACGFRIIWIYTIFQIEEFHSLESLAVSYPISWLITGIVHFIFFMVLKNRVYQKISSEISENLL